MNELTPAERRAFKARAHHLQPVVIVGDAGLTPAVLREIDVHLKSHELIKIRVLGDDRDARAAMISTISDTLNATPVQHIGKILVMFRPKPPEQSEPEKKEKSPRRRDDKPLRSVREKTRGTVRGTARGNTRNAARDTARDSRSSSAPDRSSAARKTPARSPFTPPFGERTRPTMHRGRRALPRKR